MVTLTPAERRGALVLVLLLGLGAAHDLWVAGRPATEVAGAGARATVAGHGGRAEDPSGEGAASPPPAGVAESTRAAPDPSHSATPGGPLDLNRATVSELDALPGIGPVLARRIVEHRTRHGRFERVEELLAVRGIGPRLFERLRPLVGVGRAG